MSRSSIAPWAPESARSRGQRSLCAFGVALVCGLACATPASASFELVKTFAEGESPELGGPKVEEGFGGGTPAGMAVNDATGDVYVAAYSQKRVMRFDSQGRFLEAWGWGVGDGKNEYERCGPDGEVTQPVCKGGSPSGSGNGISGEGAGQLDTQEDGDRYIAVDQASGDVFVIAGHQSGDVQIFSSHGQPVGSFGEMGAAGAALIQRGNGIAVAASGDVYVVDGNTGGQGGDFSSRVMVFKRGVSGQYAYAGDLLKLGHEITEGGIALDQQGDVYLRIEDVLYKYGAGNLAAPAWEHTVLGSYGVTVDPVSGDVFYYDYKKNKFFVLSQADGKEIEAFPGAKGQKSITQMAFNPGLEWAPGRPGGVLYASVIYDAESEMPAFGEIFARPPVFPPRIDSESVGRVGFGSASLQAQINPRGFDTHYRFEYGSGDCAVQTCAEVPVGGTDLGSGQQDLTGGVSLSGLQPDTTYHYRVVATNQFGTVVGSDQTFTTYPLMTGGVADGRVYELVSPPFKDGGEVFPSEESHSCHECAPGEDSFSSAMQATRDGGSIVYEGNAFSATGGAVRENEYLSTRTAEGWSTIDLSPVAQSPEGSSWRAFSEDLSVGVLAQPRPALSPEAPEGYENIYVREAGGGLRPVIVSPPPDRPPGTGSGKGSFVPVFAGASSDFSHVVFAANDALTAASAFAPAAEDGGVAKNNVYEWVNRQLRLVNVLPGNAASHAGAVVGSGEELRIGAPADYSHAVSADGSRVFWTDEGSGRVYVRENGQSTTEIPDSGKFLTASVDGSKVLLNDGHIYDLQSEALSDLTGAHGGFQGLLGAGEDLSRVYFVDTEVLTGSEENGYGAKAKTGEYNAYVYDAGSSSTRYIATLSELDDQTGGFLTGDWVAAPSNRTAQATADGGFLAFMSRQPLTGAGGGSAEVFEYDFGSGRLVCASCNSSGVPSKGANFVLVNRGGAILRQPHDLLSNGRLFFDTATPLVPQDVNGVGDVYEYEPDGIGSCARTHGCTLLVSGGGGSSDSDFVDASASGADVFFTTREQLVPEDRDELIDMYDAREGGGFPTVTEPQCTGTGCQGVPGAPPIFATPSSVTFSGVGNFEPAKTAPSQAKPKQKLVRCVKGKRRKRGVCAKSLAKKARSHRKVGRVGRSAR